MRRPSPKRRSSAASPARVATACLLASLLGAGSGAADPAPDPAPAPLDLDVLAAKTAKIDVNEDALRSALGGGHPSAMVLSPVVGVGPGRSAVAWSQCGKTTCRGEVALLGGDPARPTVRKKVALPIREKVFAVDGIAFDPPAATDLDGDGEPELLFRYRVTEPPRRALGSLVHDHLAVFHLPALSLAWSHELRRAGGDSEEACAFTVERTSSGGVPGLAVTGRCARRACLEAAAPPAGCSPPRVTRESYRWQRRTASYVLLAPPPKR